MTEVVIDGVTYVPAEHGDRARPALGRIGVGVTTQNRRASLEQFIAHFEENTFHAVELVVVDDGSDVEYAEEVAPDAIVVRHKSPKGIAAAKNSCLSELLAAGCEHIFLFDDDCWPIAPGWEEPYVQSPEPHLMRMFLDLAGPKKLRDIAEIHRDQQHVAYTGARGCMLYFHRSAIEMVGGYDPIFGRWGYEHGDLSNRIYAAGLTRWRYADVVGSDQIIYSADEHEQVERVVSPVERQRLARENSKLHHARRDSGEPIFVPIERAVLTCMLTRHLDPQRGTKFEGSVTPLRDSVIAAAPEADFIVFDDAIDGTQPGYHRSVEPSATNPYFARWEVYLDYLLNAPQVGFAWLVDATDVIALRDPFPESLDMDTLYVGEEQVTLSTPWMLAQHKAGVIQELIAAAPNVRLYNAGVVGGSRPVLIAFIRSLLELYYENARLRFEKKEAHDLGVGDMGAFNHAVHRWPGALASGPAITTVFKSYQREHESAMWAHK